MGCVFCMTGQGGLVRQVGSAEIVAQVALARALRPVKKVVFMGMGEPAHNLDNVMEAIVSCVAAPAQYAALAALTGPQDYVSHAHAHYRAKRDAMLKK